MLTFLLIGGAVLALVLGIWIGLGAPGWPFAPEPHSRRLQQRSINPIAWGRTSNRERLTPRRKDERRPRFR